MKTITVSITAIAAMLAAPMVQAQEASRTFTRAGSWSLDAGEDSCQLARVFSNGEDQVALAFERNAADNTARLILVSDAFRTFRAAEEIGYSYMPANDQRMARYIRSETPDGQSYFNFGSIFMGPDPFAGFGEGGPGAGAGAGAGGPPPAAAEGADGPPAFVQPPYDRAAELEFAAGVTAIQFEEGLLSPVRLETGSLRAPFEALQACTDDLLRTWGLDWEKHQTMTRRAAPVGVAWEWIPRGIVGFQDFAAFGGARNPFRVMISAEGQPTSCEAQWVSLEERQNQQICDAIMENGSFTPALDADGQPMASYWMADYIFTLNRPFGS